MYAKPFELDRSETGQIDDLLAELASRYDDVEDEEYLGELGVFAQELPRRLRKELYRFRLEEPVSSLLRIAGFPVDDEKIGDTPTHWNDRAKPSPTLREEMMLMLCGALLGEPVGWATQQGGYLVHDVMPIPGKEKEQLGNGCEELLWWHTEDAFHPYRGDYLGMLCLRNPDAVATTFASFEKIELDERQKDLLFEPHFTIRPDESHLVKNKSSNQDADDGVREAYGTIDKMNEAPERIPVLSGPRESPYMRLDPYFMDEADHPKAQAALAAFVRQIDANLVDVTLRPGELCFIDNFKAVHGRKPFKARYDGKDRWLKRVNVVRDLRKSRTARAAPAARVLSL